MLFGKVVGGGMCHLLTTLRRFANTWARPPLIPFHPVPAGILPRVRAQCRSW